MRTFNYVALKNQKWDSEIVAYIAAIHEMKGKQDLYIRQKPQELEKLVEIAKVQSTETSNEIEGIRTTNTRLKQLLSEKTTPRTRDEEEIAGYRDVLNVIHESYEYIPVTANYLLQLHMPSLFAGKLHAVICRAWKTRVKGRDLYDYIFYLSRNVAVNMPHLKARLVDSGFIDKDFNLTCEALISMLNERFAAIDYEQAKQDVIPFIKDKTKLNIWSTEFFMEITKGLNA